MHARQEATSSEEAGGWTRDTTQSQTVIAAEREAVQGRSCC